MIILIFENVWLITINLLGVAHVWIEKYYRKENRGGLDYLRFNDLMSHYFAGAEDCTANSFVRWHQKKDERD